MSYLDVVPTTIPNIPGFTSGGTLVPPAGVGSSGVSVQNGTSSFGPTIVGLVLVFLAVLVVLSLVGVLVIIIVANRADPDPKGRRPQSVYYFAVSFVTLALAIVGSAVVVSGVVAFVGNHSNSVMNAAARAIVFGGFATLISIVLLVEHLRRGLALARADSGTQGPSQRVGQSYVSAVAFVSVLTFVLLWVFSVYLVFSLAGPGVFGSFGSRSATVRVLIVAVYLLVVAAVVLWTHRRLVKPELDIFGSVAEPDVPTPGAVADA